MKSVLLLLCISTLSFDLIKGEVNNGTTTVKQINTDSELVESLRNGSTIGSKSKSLDKLTSRIVNGTRAVSGQFPYQVSLRYRNSNQNHFCGASILTPKWVLTAGHCVWMENVGRYRSPSTILVVAGEIYLKDTSKARAWSNVSRIVPHPNFIYRTLQNDLALLELETPICFSNYVHGVPLARAPTPGGTMCQVSGWGYKVFGGSQVSNDLLYVDLPVVGVPRCRELMWRFSLIPTGMMCAGYEQGGRDACQGDSGGGMVCSGLLTGVVSGGEGCAWPKLPGLYADIHIYTKWIEKHVKDFSEENKFCSSAWSTASPAIAPSIFALLLTAALHLIRGL